MLKLEETILQAELLGDNLLMEEERRALVAAALRAARVEGPGVYEVHYVHFGTSHMISIKVIEVKV